MTSGSSRRGKTNITRIPIFKMANDTVALIVKIQRELGLTPSARESLKAEKAPQPKDDWDGYGDGSDNVEAVPRDR